MPAWACPQAQLRENEKVSSRRVREFTPRKVYETSVMNAAYSRCMSALLNQPRYFEAYRGTPLRVARAKAG